MDKWLGKYIASLDYFDKSLIVSSVTTGSISIASFATIIGAPVGIVSASYSARFNSRHSTMVNIPKFKLKSARASFYVQDAVLFNELPKEMQMVNDCKEFKGLLKGISLYVPACNTYCGSAI